MVWSFLLTYPQCAQLSRVHGTPAIMWLRVRRFEWKDEESSHLTENEWARRQWQIPLSYSCPKGNNDNNNDVDGTLPTGQCQWEIWWKNVMCLHKCFVVLETKTSCFSAVEGYFTPHIWLLCITSCQRNQFSLLIVGNLKKLFPKISPY